MVFTRPHILLFFLLSSYCYILHIFLRHLSVHPSYVHCMYWLKLIFNHKAIFLILTELSYWNYVGWFLYETFTRMAISKVEKYDNGIRTHIDTKNGNILKSRSVLVIGISKVRNRNFNILFIGIHKWMKYGCDVMASSIAMILWHHVVINH